MNFKQQYGRQLGMQIPVAIIGMILAIAIPTYIDYRAQDRVWLALVANAVPVQQQVIEFYEEQRRLPIASEIKTSSPVQVTANGIVRLSLDTVDEDLQGGVLELVPAIENGQLIWRCRLQGADDKYMPRQCSKDEILTATQPRDPDETVEQKSFDWAAAIAALFSAAIGLAIFAAVIYGLVRLVLYVHWRIKSPTNRLLAYFYDDLDLREVSILNSCLEKGADSNATDNMGRSLLYRTAIGCHEDHMQPLLEHGADPRFKYMAEGWGDTVLTEALRWSECSKDIIALLLEKGADANVRGRDDQTPMHIAIEAGQEAGVFQALIRHGADLQTRDENGNSLLLKAAMTDVETGPFIDAGLDVYAMSHEGLTALWYAVAQGNQENIDRLLDHGAEINISDKNGKTLAMLATEQYDLDTLIHLASRGVNLYAQDKRGNSVLMYGVYSEDQLYEVDDRYYEIDGAEHSPLQWLLQQGLDAGIRNNDAETVLMRAAKLEDERALAVLKAHGIVD